MKKGNTAAGVLYEAPALGFSCLCLVIGEAYWVQDWGKLSSQAMHQGV